MKAKLNFRSRRTIIITSVIAILVIAALIGVYAFVKGSQTAGAVDEGQNDLDAQAPEIVQSQDAQNGNDNNGASATTAEEAANGGQAQTTIDGIAGNGNDAAASGTAAARGTVGTTGTATTGTTGAAGVAVNNGAATDATVTTDTVYDNVVTEEPWESHSVAWKPETPQFISPNVKTAGENNKDVKTQVIVTKVWEDSDATKQYRPDVTFNLYNEADQTKAVRENVGLNENNQAVFNDLQKYDKAGTEIKYIVKENRETNGQIEGNTDGVIYGVVYSGENGILTVTNKIDYTSVKTEITGTKTWIDGGKAHNNSTEVKLTLTRTVTKGETTTEPETVNATPTWNGNTYTYSGLEKYNAEGYAYSYNVSEAKVDGYDNPVQEGNNFTNTITDPSDVTVTGTKTWIDGGKAHNNSTEVKLTLTRTVTKGETTTEPETVNATPTWNGNTYTYSGLEKYNAEGYAYNYSVSEEKVDGYDNPVQEGNDFTNTITDPSDVTVTGTKTWIDGGKSHDNSKEVKLTLTRTVTKGETATEPETVNATPTWNGNTYTYSNLEKYDAEGYAYNYSVSEEKVEGYDNPVQEGNNFTNTITEPSDVTVTGTKTWIDGGKSHDNSKEVKLTLTRISAKANSKAETVKDAQNADEDLQPTWNGNTYTYSGLEKYDAEGYAYSYNVGEAKVEGYNSEIVKDNNGKYNITNRMENLNDKTEITGTKTWVDGGKSHDNSKEVKLTLTRTSSKANSKAETVKDTQNQTEDLQPTWKGSTYTYSNLEKYDAEGYAYNYSVSEEKVAGYNSEIVKDNNGKYNITNRMENLNDKTEITGTKTWIDGGKAHDNSKEIKLTLTRTSAKANSKTETVNATPTWNGSTYTYSNLEKYDAEGYEYTYKVTEAPVNDYTAKYDKYNITNTKNLMLYKKAVDKSGNEIKKLIYNEKNEENNKFNYVLTVVSQQTMNNKQTVTDELPKEIKIVDNWKKPNNVTVTTDSKDNNRQIVKWTVDLSDEKNLTQELTIPVKAEKALFNEHLKEETEISGRTILDYTFTTVGDTNVSSQMSSNNDGKNANIFLRTLNTAEPTKNQGYIYAGTVKATDLAKADQEDAYARIYDNNGNYINRNYNDTTVNNILASTDNDRIENMLDDFSRDNADAKNGIGKFIKGGLPSEATVNENLNKLYNGKIQLTKSQIILWYKVPASEDTSRSRYYTITSSTGENIFTGNVPLNECNYHIDGLIIDINHNQYIPLGTKVSVVNTAKLGDLSATATLDIYYEIESDSRAKANGGASALSINNALSNALEQKLSAPQAEPSQAKAATKAAAPKVNEQKDTKADKTKKPETQKTESAEQKGTTNSTKATTDNTVKEETKNTETKTKDSAKTEKAEADTTEAESEQEK